MKNMNYSLEYIIKIIVFITMCFVFSVAVFMGAGGDENRIMVLIVSAAGIFLMWAVRLLSDRFEVVLKKYFYVILAVYLIVLFAVQLCIGNKLQFTPKWDIDAVYGGAINWLEDDSLNETYTEYFGYFPNNLGLLTVFRIVFGIARGVMGDSVDYIMAAMVASTIVVTLTRFSVIMVIRELMGNKWSYVAMLVLALCFPLYVSSPVFYTDVMSMAAPVLCLWCYLKAVKENCIWKKLIWYAVLGVSAAVGSEIKFTVFIMLLAIGINILLKKQWKEFIIYALIQTVIMCTVFGIVNQVVYSELLDRDEAAIMNTPVSHWFMMGASGENGAYNGEDYEYTRGFATVEERDKAVYDEIIRRYKDKGIAGTLNLWKNKTSIEYGTGTYGMEDFLWYVDEENICGLHDWVTGSGTHYKDYQILCLGIHLVILFFCIAGIVGSFHINNEKDGLMCAAWMYFFGLWFFLMFWESSARYTCNSLGIMVVMAVYGMPYGMDILKRVKLWFGTTWGKRKSCC